MNNSVIILSVFGAITTFLLIALFIQSKKVALLRTNIDLLSNQLAAIQTDIQGITRSAIGSDQKISSMSKIQKNLSVSIEKLESSLADERPYKTAVDLVKQGASTQRLVNELHLTEGEAQLIHMLHSSEQEESVHQNN